MIRIATQADVAAMLAVYAPYVTDTTYSFEYTVPTLEVFTQRFVSISEAFPWLVWEEDGKLLGYAYGSLPFERAAYAWCGEVSIYLAPQAQGRGVGRRLYTALEKLMRLQGYHRVYALVTSENTGSLAFHEKLGYRLRAEFTDCGYKKGRWLGVRWLEKELKKEEKPMQMPTPWHILREKIEDLLQNIDVLPLP